MDCPHAGWGTEFCEEGVREVAVKCSIKNCQNPIEETEFTLRQITNKIIITGPGYEVGKSKKWCRTWKASVPEGYFALLTFREFGVECPDYVTVMKIYVGFFSCPYMRRTS